MDEKWTLAEGIEKLFAPISDDSGVGDLSTCGRQIISDVSFVEIETSEIDGIKVEPTKGISVILTAGEEGWSDVSQNTW